MKKVILMAFLAAGTAFTSCSKDDDAPSRDPLVGSWVMTKFTTTFRGEDNEEGITGCDDNEINATFNLDGTYTAGKFEQFDGGCAMNEGTWENLGDGMYTLIDDGEGINLDITFSENEFTLVSEPDVEDDDEGERTSSTITYQKK